MQRGQWIGLDRPRPEANALADRRGVEARRFRSLGTLARGVLGVLPLLWAGAVCADSPTAPSSVTAPPVALQTGVRATAAAARTPRAAAWSLSVTCTKAKSTTACTNSNVSRGNRVTLAAVVTGLPRGLSRRMTWAWSLTSATSQSNNVHNCTAANVGRTKRCGYFKSVQTESKVRWRAPLTHPRVGGNKWNKIRITLAATDRNGDSKFATYDVRVNAR